MKIIAVTQRLIQYGDAQTINNSSDAELYPFLISNGFLPLFLPCGSNAEMYYAKIGFDGILLSGGNDLSSFSNNDIDLMRDEFEYSLLEFAVRRQIPVLGICRGMQVICSHFGAGISKIDAHAGTRHKVKFSSSSRYFGSVLEKEVNSYHKYGVNIVSENLNVAAISGDGVIEAVEHKNHRICGIMWHPEREKNYDSNDIYLFNRIFGQAE